MVKGVGWILKFWDWRNLFAFLTSLTLIDEQRGWKRERERPPKSKDTLSWKQEKNDPIWRANTPTYTIQTYHVRIPWYPHVPTFPSDAYEINCSEIETKRIWSWYLDYYIIKKLYFD